MEKPSDTSFSAIFQLGEVDRPLLDGRDELGEEEVAAGFAAEEAWVLSQVVAPDGLPQGAQTFLRARPGQHHVAVFGPGM